MMRRFALPIAVFVAAFLGATIAHAGKSSVSGAGRGPLANGSGVDAGSQGSGPAAAATAGLGYVIAFGGDVDGVGERARVNGIATVGGSPSTTAALAVAPAAGTMDAISWSGDSDAGDPLTFDITVAGVEEATVDVAGNHTTTFAVSIAVAKGDSIGIHYDAGTAPVDGATWQVHINDTTISEATGLTLGWGGDLQTVGDYALANGSPADTTVGTTSTGDGQTRVVSPVSGTAVFLGWRCSSLITADSDWILSENGIDIATINTADDTLNAAAISETITAGNHYEINCENGGAPNEAGLWLYIEE